MTNHLFDYIRCATLQRIGGILLQPQWEESVEIPGMG